MARKPEAPDQRILGRRAAAIGFHIGLVALTSKADSALARAADVKLVLPRVEEACPNGLAPTTSTTMQLVMGDALAVALLAARGFTAQDFRVFHPGGKLGAKLTLVRDVMHKDKRVGRGAEDFLRFCAAAQRGRLAAHATVAPPRGVP